ADRNRSHWSTSKTPSYTKSVSWQHHHDIPGNATQAIEKIKHIGSSSGCDMLYGMADGCALSQTYGGNYVS
ncbi:DUF2877 domain-containing protein, partial [Escherichia coli]|uniref:oxamate carbamoyltransferase subunit AllH family protein n=1 Tax=Escherichia coli TaxID=562 RepID=UPI00313B6CD4